MKENFVRFFVRPMVYMLKELSSIVVTLLTLLIFVPIWTVILKLNAWIGSIWLKHSIKRGKIVLTQEKLLSFVIKKTEENG